MSSPVVLTPRLGLLPRARRRRADRARRDRAPSASSSPRRSSRRASTCGSARRRSGCARVSCPGGRASVRERLESLSPERISLEGEGAVLEKGIVYLAPLERTARAAARRSPAPPTRKARPAGSTFSCASSSTAAPRSTRRRRAIAARFGSRFRRAAFPCACARDRGSTSCACANAAAPRRAFRRGAARPPRERRRWSTAPLELRDGLVVHVGLAGAEAPSSASARSRTAA